MMSGTTNNSFPNQSHLDLLMRADKSLASAEPLLRMAEECGIDCSEQRAGQEFLRERIDTLRRVLFPDNLVPPSGLASPPGPE